MGVSVYVSLCLSVCLCVLPGTAVKVVNWKELHKV